MKTHSERRWPLIVVFRLAGITTMIVSYFRLFLGETDWQLIMCIALGWLILATAEECEARLRDAAEKQG